MNQPSDLNPDDLHSRLVSLEELFLHQQRLTQDLSEELVHQGQWIERLERELARLRSQVATIEQTAQNDHASGEEPPPPHY